MLYIIEDYKKLLYHIDDAIKLSGFRVDYLAERLNMPKTTFYHKRKTHSFTVEEMERMFTLIDNEEMENKILGKIMIERMDEPNVGYDVLNNALKGI